MSSLFLERNTGTTDSLTKPLKGTLNSAKTLSTEEICAATQRKSRVESAAFLDELFTSALRLAQRQAEAKAKENATDTSKQSIQPKIMDMSNVSIGIDIVCYGAYNAKMAYVLTKSESKDTAVTDRLELEVIETVDDHIGHLKYNTSYTAAEAEFVEQFQSMMRTTFLCFGKRWFELSELDKRMPSNANFKLVEVDQFPQIYFGEARSFTMNQLVCMFFQTMLKCVRTHVRCPATAATSSAAVATEFKKICVTLPSDFHSYQRLVLKQCFESIGLRDFILVNKSTSLTLPFLKRDLNDSTKKFIIDFGSGKFILQHGSIGEIQTKVWKIFNKKFFLIKPRK
jgi:hypothetical protein